MHSNIRRSTLIQVLNTLTMRNFTLVLCMLATLLLHGCATKRKDGPPAFYVDETKIPNAVPKIEPLSRIGNQPFYHVFGKRYYTLKSSKHYQERGIASWYGTKFHSHRTSNGERYDMLAMTAAHKTLPLPTYVEVTNLANGLKVIVKVNDRGPFEQNRLIDLSYVAAKKLGMLGHGTTVVDVKAIDPGNMFEKPKVYVTPTNQQLYNKTLAAQKKSIYLQVGEYTNRTYAERLKKRLASLVKAPANIRALRHQYAVHLGPFKDVLVANQVRNKLQIKGLHCEKVSF